MAAKKITAKKKQTDMVPQRTKSDFHGKLETLNETLNSIEKGDLVKAVNQLSGDTLESILYGAEIIFSKRMATLKPNETGLKKRLLDGLVIMYVDKRLPKYHKDLNKEFSQIHQDAIFWVQEERENIVKSEISKCKAQIKKIKALKSLNWQIKVAAMQNEIKSLEGEVG